MFDFAQMRREAGPVAEAAAAAMGQAVDENELARLKKIAREASVERVGVAVSTGRYVVLDLKAEEPLQYIVNQSPHHVAWLLRGWDKYLADAHAQAQKVKAKR